MQRNYVYKSIIFHIAVLLLCITDISFFSDKHKFDEQPPIIVNLDDVVISDMTNIPEKAIRGEERKPAMRKEETIEETFTQKQPVPVPETKEESKPEPVVEETDIKAPSLIEEAQKFEENKEEPKKESEKPQKEKKKSAPIPQKKPQLKPNKKPAPKKKPEPTKKPVTTANQPKKNTPTVRSTNPLESLMNSVDNLQKQIGEEDSPAQIPNDEPVTNMGIEGGNSQGSYFSELSVSGIDFVKSKIQESWKTIVGGKDKDIKVIINVSLTKEGGIKDIHIEDMGRYRSDTNFQALADSAERAIRIAQEVHNVFTVLATQNGSRYNDWKNIRFTFTPLGLSK